MPLYEYRCSSCSTDFTLLQSIHDRPEDTSCPECGAGDVTKKLSAFAPSVSPGGSPMPRGGCGGVPGGACGGGMCGMGG